MERWKNSAFVWWDHLRKRKSYQIDFVPTFRVGNVFRTKATRKRWSNNTSFYMQCKMAQSKVWYYLQTRKNCLIPCQSHFYIAVTLKEGGETLLQADTSFLVENLALHPLFRICAFHTERGGEKTFLHAASNGLHRCCSAVITSGTSKSTKWLGPTLYPHFASI